MVQYGLRLVEGRVPSSSRSAIRKTPGRPGAISGDAEDPSEPGGARQRYGGSKQQLRKRYVTREDRSVEILKLPSTAARRAGFTDAEADRRGRTGRHRPPREGPKDSGLRLAVPAAQLLLNRGPPEPIAAPRSGHGRRQQTPRHPTTHCTGCDTEPSSHFARAQQLVLVSHMATVGRHARRPGTSVASVATVALS